MSEYIVGKSVDRPPRKVKLALVGEYILVCDHMVCYISNSLLILFY